MEKRINGHTRLYALIGSPVGHSGSPAMQNYSFEKLGIDAAYLAFDVNVGQTAKALEAFRTLNVGGFNVTMPCKTEVARPFITGCRIDRCVQYGRCGRRWYNDRSYHGWDRFCTQSERA